MKLYQIITAILYINVGVTMIRIIKTKLIRLLYNTYNTSLHSCCPI